MRIPTRFLAIASFTLISAAAVAQTPASYVPFPMTTSEMMVNVIASLPNPIWEKSYLPELSDEDWSEIKLAASQLLAGATLISVGGSDAAENGWLDDPQWRQWSEAVAATANAALAAVEARDQMGLQAAGDKIVEDCMGCHVVFDPTAR
jgi:hypothetical protein